MWQSSNLPPWIRSGFTCICSFLQLCHVAMHLRVELHAIRYGNGLIFKKIRTHFPKQWYPFKFLIAVCKQSSHWPTSQILGIIWFPSCKLLSHCGLSLLSFNYKWSWTPFHAIDEPKMMIFLDESSVHNILEYLVEIEFQMESRFCGKMRFVKERLNHNYLPQRNPGGVV